MVASEYHVRPSIDLGAILSNAAPPNDGKTSNEAKQVIKAGRLKNSTAKDSKG